MKGVGMKLPDRTIFFFLLSLMIMPFRAGYGESADAVVSSATKQVSIAPPTIEIDMSHAANGLEGGRPVAVRWKASGIEYIKIELSQDDGVSWQRLAGFIDAQQEEYYINMPRIDGYVRIRVSSNNAGDSCYAVSDPIRIYVPAIHLISPAGGDTLAAGSVHRIRWNMSNMSVSVSLYFLNGKGIDENNHEQIAHVPAGQNYFDWTVPDINTEKGYISIDGYNGHSKVAMNNGPFTIVMDKPYIALEFPLNSDRFYCSRTETLRWRSRLVETVSIEYSLNHGATWTVIAENLDEAIGEIDWTAPDHEVAVMFHIYDPGNPEIGFDTDDLDVTVPHMSLQSPLGGERFFTGTTTIIEWSYLARTDPVRIEYSTDSGQTWKLIGTAESQAGAIQWTIPDDCSTRCRVRVTAVDNENMTAQCGADFTISGPTITIDTSDLADGIIGGRLFTVRWNTPETGKLRIDISENDGVSWHRFTDNVLAESGSAAVYMPYTEGFVRFRISAGAGNTVISDPIPVISPSVTLESPEGGETLVVGSVHRIRWSFPYTSDKVALLFVNKNNSGTETRTHITAVTDGQKYYDWTVPDRVTSHGYIRVKEINGIATDTNDEPFSIVPYDPVSVSETPLEFSLGQNSPNPFNPVTAIPFSLAESSPVRLEIFNLAGEKVAVLADSAFPAGNHELTWDASGHASGIYFARLTTSGFSATTKMLLIK